MAYGRNFVTLCDVTTSFETYIFPFYPFKWILFREMYVHDPGNPNNFHSQSKIVSIFYGLVKVSVFVKYFHFIDCCVVSFQCTGTCLIQLTTFFKSFFFIFCQYFTFFLREKFSRGSSVFCCCFEISFE